MFCSSQKLRNAMHEFLTLCAPMLVNTKIPFNFHFPPQV
uniref:Uncharacterized protein n=1 Tax=Rhizophora mucronata TaxID=61149 RepID=A0A2P2J5I3_RHIMU